MAEVEEIFAQLSRACRELGVVLCGGHTEITHGLDRPIVVGQMLGEVEEEKLVSPDKIRPGDEVLLTKGIAIEGTALIAREKKGLESILGVDQVERCRGLLRNPGISVVREARRAGEVARVHAMHDPTEGGLATGLRELAEASGLGMRVEMEKIAVFPETEVLCGKLRLDPLGLLASGALLIVTAEEDSQKVRRGSPGGGDCGVGHRQNLGAGERDQAGERREEPGNCLFLKGMKSPGFSAEGNMSPVQTRYKNKKFVKERIELDGHSYENCTFEGCLIVLEKGEAEIKGCTFNQCRLMLLEQALRIAKILQLFIGDKPLKVLDFAEPGVFGERQLATEGTEDTEKK